MHHSTARKRRLEGDLTLVAHERRSLTVSTAAGRGAPTVRMPCQSPTSFLKSNTFTIVSAAEVKEERFPLTKEAQKR